MSWIQKLYETYENCSPLIGAGATEEEIPLLPICHTTQKAQIEIVLGQYGNFIRARVIPREEARTIIPCTENSGGRSGIKPEPHPLCDKLQYVAGDFSNYGGVVTKGYLKKPKEPFERYISLLSQWCASKYGNSKVKAVLEYTQKEKIMADLIDYMILHLDTNKRLLGSWPGKNKPEIFKILQGNMQQSDCFVRWIVEIPNDPQTEVWNDSTIFDSWIAYYSSQKGKTDLCYVTGQTCLMADQHPAKIRNDGDKAKLISANDSNGFTFRGRFTTAAQACGVGFVVTQKAHNALRWLIGKQGYRRGSHAIVAWATKGQDIPDPLADAYLILGLDAGLNNLMNPEEASSAQDLALRLNKKIAGYHSILGNTERIIVIALDSATPGRMSITFYRELTETEFLHRIEKWHATCCWAHNYRVSEFVDDKTKKKKKIYPLFVGAPAPGDIAEAAFGRRLDDKLRNATVDRVLPCIIDGQRMPRDLVESVVNRARNRISMDAWEWDKTLSIACALFRKYAIDYKGVDYGMALDETRRNRDYLYGRLLALADTLEQWALHEAGENRQTSAARLMQRFADHPYTTWRILELSLTPYKARLGAKSQKRQDIMAEVMALFAPDDFINDQKLNGEFLLGYHCQREALRKKNKDIETTEQN